MIKITVYMPCYNYADYVERAIESVLDQTMDDWELIVIDDGSTDNSREKLAAYADHERITVVEQENKGLNVTNNIALRLARGSYVMRLDADDFLDENALLVLSNTLDKNPEAGLVFPDYFQVDKDGEILELIRRQKIGDEIELLDLPAHGACTMFRRDVLLQLDGYAEDYTCQDGYEIWLRFIRRFKPVNVNIPLFYYRQHSTSLTRDEKKILDTRRQIKKEFVEREHNGERPTVLGIIPVANRSPYPKNDPMIELAGKPLIWHTLSQAQASNHLDRTMVSTGNPDVLEYIRSEFPEIGALERPDDLEQASMLVIANHVLERMEAKDGYIPAAVCTLPINTPLCQSHHIDWAIDTLQVFGVDSVISVQEDVAPFYFHDVHGMRPVHSVPGMRLERESLFKSVGAIHLTRTENLKNGTTEGKTVGHVTLLPEESVRINSEFEFWLAEKLLSKPPS